jgi:hypothetical protein
MFRAIPNMIQSTAKRGKSFLAATLNGLEDEYSPCNSIGKEDRDVPTTIVAKRKMVTLSSKVQKKETIMTPEFSLGTAHSSSHWRKQSGSLSTSSTISSKHSDRDSIGSSERDEDGERIDENDSLKHCSKQLFTCNECDFQSQDFRNNESHNCHMMKEECSNRQEGMRYFTSPWDFQSPIQLQPDNFHLMKRPGGSNKFPSIENELNRKSTSHLNTNIMESNFRNKHGAHVNQVPPFIPFWYQQNYSPQPMVFHQFYRNPFYGTSYTSSQTTYPYPHHPRVYAPRWH